MSSLVGKPVFLDAIDPSDPAAIFAHPRRPFWRCLLPRVLQRLLPEPLPRNVQGHPRLARDGLALARQVLRLGPAAPVFLAVRQGQIRITSGHPAHLRLALASLTVPGTSDLDLEIRPGSGRAIATLTVSDPATRRGVSLWIDASDPQMRPFLTGASHFLIPA